MTDEISDLRLFLTLVAAGGLSAAARVLSSSPPAMSRRLAALEDRLGVRLVERTSRRFNLTVEGHLFHERCLKIIADIDEAEAEASSSQTAPRGLLRVGAPTELGRRLIAPLVSQFTGLNPQVRVRLSLSDAVPDVTDDGLDIAICIGLPPQQGPIAVKLLSSRAVLCAAPDYLARRGAPNIPEDLAGHDCIRLMRGHRLLDHWQFKQDGARKEVHVHGTLSATSAEVVHDWVLAGKGIAMKAYWDIRDDLMSGRLVECLAEYFDNNLELYAIYASRQHLPPRLRAFLEHVKTGLAAYMNQAANAARDGHPVTGS